MPGVCQCALINPELRLQVGGHGILRGEFFGDLCGGNRAEPFGLIQPRELLEFLFRVVPQLLSLPSDERRFAVALRGD